MNPVEIVARREALGLSQVQLAALLGVAQNTVSAWERGKRNIPAGVHTDLESLEALQDELISETTQTLLGASGRVVLTLPMATPGNLPDSFQRVVAANILRDVRGEGREISLVQA